MILLDTSVLLAAIDASQRQRDAARRTLEQTPPPDPHSGLGVRPWPDVRQGQPAVA